MLKVASRGLLFAKHEIQNLIPQIQALPRHTGSNLYHELLKLLLNLSKCSYSTLSENSFLDDLPSTYESRMAKIHEFVELQFHRKILLKELADLVSLSEQSYSRFFKKMMGRSFFTFLNEYRINMASRMLIDTDWPVSEIGYKCGYESLPFFHKQFNKYKAISPSKYRKQYTGSAISL